MYVKRMNRRGGASEYWNRKITGAATLAGFLTGAAVGDFKSAASTGTAMGGVAGSMYNDASYRNAERKLEKNQRVFAGAYNDFAEAYRADGHENATDEEIRIAAKEIFDEGGSISGKAYEQDMWSQMDQLKDSAEIMGYTNGFDYINSTMRMAADGIIEPDDDYVQTFYDSSTGSRITYGDTGEGGATFDESAFATSNQEYEDMISDASVRTGTWKPEYNTVDTDRARNVYGSDYQDYTAPDDSQQSKDYANLYDAMGRFFSDDQKRVLLERKRYLDQKYGH